jgi:hypothetical protein
MSLEAKLRVFSHNHSCNLLDYLWAEERSVTAVGRADHPPEETKQTAVGPGARHGAQPQKGIKHGSTDDFGKLH